MIGINMNLLMGINTIKRQKIRDVIKNHIKIPEDFPNKEIAMNRAIIKTTEPINFDTYG